MRWFMYLLFFVGMAGYAVFYQLPNICDNPISYQIGTVDARFNLTKDDVLDRIEEAEKHWEDSSNRDLFVYKPGAENAVTIRMIYDERQNYQSQVNSEKEGVDKQKESLQPRIEDFNRRSDELQKKVMAFNQKIMEWNKRDDQTESEYQQLVNEQSSLDAEGQVMNDEARSLQQNTRDYNLKVDELNSTIGSLQEVVQSKPEEGLYEGAKNLITIFYHNGRDELVHTIEHELGHALGLEHILNPDAVMYAKTNQTTIPTTDDLQALTKVCQKETPLERMRSKKWQSAIKHRLDAIMQP